MCKIFLAVIDEDVLNLIHKKMSCQKKPIITSERRGSKMALLAAPRSEAFFINKKDEQILRTRSNAVLNALRKIRKAEASTGSAERLAELDRRISALEEKRR